MPYQNFLISDFETGKDIGREPWLTPADALPDIENMRVNKGVLEKRLGFSPFAQMNHGGVNQTNTPIMGIHTYARDGQPKLLVMDTKRVNLYNAVDGTMTDISSDISTPIDIFSGNDDDFFSFVNWQNVGYMVNNVDQIYQYQGDGAAIPFNYQFDSTDSKANHLDTCKFLFIKDDRLFFLDTVEFGQQYRQRLRFTPVLQTDGLQSGGGRVDAPTEHVICSATKLQNGNIAVFMRGDNGGSTWEIQNTGNTDVPYRWKQISELEGCRSPYSAVPIKAGQDLRDGVATAGVSNILFYDGFRVRDLDEPKLRDVLDTFNDAKIRNVYSYYQFEQRRLLMTFADSGSSNVDIILDYNSHENNWTIHKSNQTFFVSTIGGFNGQKVPSWVEADNVFGQESDTMADADWDSREIGGSPKPFTLIGCRNSQVYKWLDGEFDGTNDANGNIPMLARTSRLNPFVKDGNKVAMGAVKIFVDNDSSASFTVKLYKNTSSTAYKTQTVSCNGSNDKFWTTVFADGEVGDFHRIEVSHDARGNTPRIHAFDIEMRPAGRLDL
jgi:hypothetical protein